MRQKFGSKERDIETGLDYFLARYHSSAQGRFTSVDPDNDGANPADPQSWNGYAYARSNPVLYSDPDGRRYLVCGPNGGGSCGFVSDLEFNRDRDALESLGLVFTGGREFHSQGSILFNGELQATYQQLSIDDNANKLGFEMQLIFNSSSIKTRAAAGILGSVILRRLLRSPGRSRMGNSVGAMRRLEYQASPKHHKNARGNVSPAPRDGQASLDNSVQIKDTSPRRIGMDPQTGEITVFDETTPGVFHGHVRTWGELTQQMKKALVDTGLYSSKGKPLL